MLNQSTSLFNAKIKLLILATAITLTSACTTTSSSQKNYPAAPPEAQSYYDRAVKEMKSGNTNQAFQLFNAIYKKYPNFAGPQLNIGLMYLKKNKLTKAENAFKLAIKSNADNAISYNLLGVAYRRNGKFNEAKEAYLQAITKDEKYAKAHLNLGILYDIYLNDLKRAVHHYEQYQKFAQAADNKVAKWIVDLKRRTKAEQSSKAKT